MTFEQAAEKYGNRAIEFIKAAEWVKEYPAAASDYACDAVTAAKVAGHFAFAAHPEWREGINWQQEEEHR